MRIASVIVASLLGIGCYAEAQPAPAYPAAYGPPGAVVVQAPMQPVPVMPVQAAPMPMQPMPMQAMPPERAQRRAVLQQMLLAQFDRNHDGVLEPRERRQEVRALRRLARRLARENRAMGRGGMAPENADP